MGVHRPARQNAITNSPFVRALIQPVLRKIPSLQMRAQTATLAGAVPSPETAHLIPTQPLIGPVISSVESFDAPVASTSQLGLGEPSAGAGKGKKRAREDEPQEEVIVAFTRKNLPKELNKYWAQRYRLWSLFDSGIKMDLEGWYSVTPELIAHQIAERCRAGVIVDAFCGVGGNAIQFAFTCEKVIAIDISATRLACAAHNAEIYGVADRITFIKADYTVWAKEYADKLRRGHVPEHERVEVVFLSPPWGGLDYLHLGSTAQPAPSALESGTGPVPPAAQPSRTYPLAALAPLPGDELFALSRAITPHVAYYLPRNVDVAEVAGLAARFPRSDRKGGDREEVERVEVEEEWMSGKLKAVTVYYADLATSPAT